MGRILTLRIASCILILMIAFPLPSLAYSNDSPYEWPEANPEDYGFTATERSICYSVAEEMPYLRSVLVIRHGNLLVEWYFNDGSTTTAFHIHSASKSFMSALIGIAFHRGFLQSLDQKLIDFFPEYFTPSLDPRKQNITIKHLLTMTAGFNFSESTDEWIAYSTSDNWVKYAIELPLLHGPGEDWHYSTVQTNLLSAILARVADRSTRDFAEEYLFDPLGISISHWHQDPQGYYTGGHEMYFVPRDMARLGYLYLNNGSINGEQIIPSSWVQDSWFTHSEEVYPNVGYGYQWWLQQLVDYDTFSARGLGGQFIFCIPELDLVVVTTATGSILDYNPIQQPAIRQLIGYILQSFNCDHQTSGTTTTDSTTITNDSTTTSIENNSLISWGIPVIFLGSVIFIGITVVFLQRRKMLNTNR
jgi:CubicO group peptidase (beta-lactamase class C family)